MKYIFSKKGLLEIVFIVLFLALIAAVLIANYYLGAEYREATVNLENFLRDNGNVQNEEYILLKTILDNAKIEKSYYYVLSLILFFVGLSSLSFFRKLISYKLNMIDMSKQEYKICVIVETFFELLVLAVLSIYFFTSSKETIYEHSDIFSLVWIALLAIMSFLKKHVSTYFINKLIKLEEVIELVD